jgi:hypothetical protein
MDIHHPQLLLDDQLNPLILLLNPEIPPEAAIWAQNRNFVQSAT